MTDEEFRLQALGILILALSIAVLCAGLLLRRFRFLDRKKQHGASRSVSQAVGKWMILCSSILGGAALLGLIVALVG